MARDRMSTERRTGLAGPASRRTLLKGMSLAGLAAGSATLASAPAQAKPAETGQQGLNYRETDHIRKYYDLSRN